MARFTAVHSSLIASLASVLFAAVAVADPGTTWDKKFGATRFRVLSQFNDEAVLDRETGRVWERSPAPFPTSWLNALIKCYQKEDGGRRGWRLPTIEELASLVDTSQPAPTLPLGHPFENVRSAPPSSSHPADGYWSATTFAAPLDPSFGWFVSFRDGFPDAWDKLSRKFYWCVRGGQGIDGVQ